MSLRKLLDLTGKVALVTGGSRGLGLQIASGLGEMGARLALTARKADELEAARAALDREHIEALPVVVRSLADGGRRPDGRVGAEALRPDRHPGEQRRRHLGRARRGARRSRRGRSW